MKKQELLFTKLAKYYDFIYGFKNYEEEAQEIKSLIEKLKTSKGNSLLDVACGTGKHISLKMLLNAWVLISVMKC